MGRTKRKKRAAAARTAQSHARAVANAQGVDFKKSKRKLGAKSRPSNATDVTVRTRQIHLPDQSRTLHTTPQPTPTPNPTPVPTPTPVNHPIALADDIVDVDTDIEIDNDIPQPIKTHTPPSSIATKKSLAILTSTLSRISHHNAPTRTASLNTLRNILTTSSQTPHLSALRARLPTALTASAAALSDTTDTVRAAATSFLLTLLSSTSPFPPTPPHLATIRAHVLAALSHLRHDVRVSAASFIAQLACQEDAGGGNGINSRVDGGGGNGSGGVAPTALFPVHASPIPSLSDLLRNTLSPRHRIDILHALAAVLPSPIETETATETATTPTTGLPTTARPNRLSSPTSVLPLSNEGKPFYYHGRTAAQNDHHSCVGTTQTAPLPEEVVSDVVQRVSHVVTETLPSDSRPDATGAAVLQTATQVLCRLAHLYKRPSPNCRDGISAGRGEKDGGEGRMDDGVESIVKEGIIRMAKLFIRRAGQVAAGDGVWTTMADASVAVGGTEQGVTLLMLGLEKEKACASRNVARCAIRVLNAAVEGSGDGGGAVEGLGELGLRVAEGVCGVVAGGAVGEVCGVLKLMGALVRLSVKFGLAEVRRKIMGDGGALVRAVEVCGGVGGEDALDGAVAVAVEAYEIGRRGGVSARSGRKGKRKGGGGAPTVQECNAFGREVLKAWGGVVQSGWTSDGTAGRLAGLAVRAGCVVGEVTARVIGRGLSVEGGEYGVRVAERFLDAVEWVARVDRDAGGGGMFGAKVVALVRAVAPSDGDGGGGGGDEAMERVRRQLWRIECIASGRR